MTDKELADSIHLTLKERIGVIILIEIVVGALVIAMLLIDAAGTGGPNGTTDAGLPHVSVSGAKK